MHNSHYYSHIFGNEEIKLQLDRMVSNQAIGHALLFAGPDGIGKSLFALALAKQILQESDSSKEHARKIDEGLHPDVHIYYPEGKLGLHTIHTIRQLSEEVYLPPFESTWKVFIVHGADRMLSYSANALLKTFEEPPPKTIIILISCSPAAFIPTILSRCSTFYFKPLASHFIYDFIQKEYRLDDHVCQSIVKQSQGSLGRAVALAQQGNELRLATLELFSEGRCSDYHVLQKKIRTIHTHIETIKKQTEEKAKEELLHVPADQLTAQQIQVIEKELEGIVAITSAQEVYHIFSYILSWYRDRELLLLGGSTEYLFNLDFKNELERVMQLSDGKSLEQAYKAIEEAQLAFSRSTSLTTCLENIFLKLN